MSGLPTIVHASQAPGGQQCFTQLVHAHQNGLRVEPWTAQAVRTVDGFVFPSVLPHASKESVQKPAGGAQKQGAANVRRL